jgi:hypothetical protein
LGAPDRRDHWEDLDVGGTITLSWTLGRLGSIGRTGFGWLRIESSGNESLGSIKKADCSLIS